MELFVAITCDRHAEPSPEVFSTLDGAIAFARTSANVSSLKGTRRAQGFPIEEPQDEDGDVVFAIRYSSEDDCIYIVKRTLDSEVPEQDGATVHSLVYQTPSGGTNLLANDLC